MTRESINLSYFDKNKELPIDLHYEIYRNIKNDIYAIASHYPIDFVIAGTDVIKKSNETLENLIKYIEDKITEIKELNNFIIKYHSNHPLAKKSIDENILIEKTYQDLLERIKSNNYEL